MTFNFNEISVFWSDCSTFEIGLQCHEIIFEPVLQVQTNKSKIRLQYNTIVFEPGYSAEPLHLKITSSAAQLHVKFFYSAAQLQVQSA